MALRNRTSILTCFCFFSILAPDYGFLGTKIKTHHPCVKTEADYRSGGPFRSLLITCRELSDARDAGPGRDGVEEISLSGGPKLNLGGGNSNIFYFHP